MSQLETKEIKPLTKLERENKLAAMAEKDKKDQIERAKQSLYQAFVEWTQAKPCYVDDIPYYLSKETTKIFTYRYPPDSIPPEFIAEMKQKVKELGYSESEVVIKSHP